MADFQSQPYPLRPLGPAPLSQAPGAMGAMPQGQIDRGFTLSPEQWKGMQDRFGMGQHPLDQAPGGMGLPPQAQPQGIAGIMQGAQRPQPQMSGFNRQIASNPRLRNMTRGQQQRWANRQMQAQPMPMPRMGGGMGGAPQGSGQYGDLASALGGSPLRKL